jgi:hypothetical protein
MNSPGQAFSASRNPPKLPLIEKHVKRLHLSDFAPCFARTMVETFMSMIVYVAYNN